MLWSSEAEPGPHARWSVAEPRERFVPVTVMVTPCPTLTAPGVIVTPRTVEGGGAGTTVTLVLAEAEQFPMPVAVTVNVPGEAHACVTLAGTPPIGYVTATPSPKSR